MSKGIMIIGPSGSGKTSLGKMVADKLGYREIVNCCGLKFESA